MRSASASDLKLKPALPLRRSATTRDVVAARSPRCARVAPASVSRGGLESSAFGAPGAPGAVRGLMLCFRGVGFAVVLFCFPRLRVGERRLERGGLRVRRGQLARRRCSKRGH